MLQVGEAPAAAPPQPSRLDRLRASFDQSALDDRIAAGGATVDDARLTARSWQLTRPRTRAHLADTIERVIHDSDEMQRVAGVSGRSVHRDVRAARAELMLLVLRLRDELPVQPAGVARVSLLLWACDSPLYVLAKEPDKLWQEVHAARNALDGGAGEASRSAEARH